MIIYILTATSGDYSERDTYNVKAFKTLAGAEKLREKLQKQSREIVNRLDTLNREFFDNDLDDFEKLEQDKKAILGEYAAYMSEYDITYYTVAEIELEEE